MKKAAIFKRLRRSGAIVPAAPGIRRLWHRGPGKNVLLTHKGQALHHPVDLGAFHVMLGLAVFADGLLNLSNGTHSSVLSWQVVGLRVTAFLFWLEIEDMPLDNVGIPLNFDLLAALGVQGLPVAVLGEKQANLIAGATVGGTGLTNCKLDHPAGLILESLHSQNVMSFQLTG